MPHSIKIATCCYCGTRATLVLSARHGRELACAACGAPLHQMKNLKTQRDAVYKRQSALPHLGDLTRKPLYHAPEKNRKIKRKPVLRNAIAEIWDDFEDIFDDFLD